MVNPADNAEDDKRSNSSSRSVRSALRSQTSRRSSRRMSKKIVSWHDADLDNKGANRGNATDRPSRPGWLDRFGNEPLLSCEFSEDGVNSATSSEKRRLQIQDWVTQEKLH